MKTNVPAPTVRVIGKKTEVGYTVAACVCVLMNCGLAFTFAGAFPSSETAPGWVALWGILISGLFLAAVRFRTRRWAIPAAAAAVALPALIFVVRLMDGAALLYNDVMDLLCVRTGRIFLRIVAPEDADPLAAVLFLSAVCAVLIVGAAVSRSLLPVLPLLAAAGIGAAAGVLEVNVGFAALFCGAVMLFISASLGRKAVPRAAVAPFGALAVLTALSLLAASVLPFNAQGSRARVQKALHTLCFSDKTAVLPEGRLSDYAGPASSDAPALEVTLSSPQRLLLRGYIGEVYTGGGFAPVPGEEAVKARTLFYLLHTNGFYGGAVLGAAYTAEGDADRETLEVKPVGACRRYLYAPYTVLQEGQFSAGLIGDAKLYASSGAVRKMTYVPGQIADWVQLEARLLERQKEPAVDAYLTDESAYRNYVYAEYLQITDEAKAALTPLLEGRENVETLGQALRLTERALDGAFYKTTVEASPGEGEDYIAAALKRHAGSGVSRATAAVLMLRCLGVPARYVEGYEITEDDAADMTPGEAYTLTEENARAWAEYYFDGLGWFPLEPLPGVGGEGKTPNETRENESSPPEEEPGAEPPEEESTAQEDPTQEEDISGEEPSSGEEQPEETQAAALMEETTEEPPSDEEEEDKADASEEDAARDGASALFWWLLLLLLLLLLIAAVVLRARWACAKRLKRIENAPAREAVVREFAYTLLLLRAGAPDRAGNIADAKRFAEEAYFSGHEPPPALRNWMREYRLALVSAGEKRWPLPKRLWLRFVVGLY